MSPLVGTAHQYKNEAASGGVYRHRDPERTLLHQVIRENWETFQACVQRGGKDLPFYIEREFESYLTCGVLAHGFVRLKCEKCPHEKLVAFSCKKRGFCPSCCGRRMAESGAFLSEGVFPAGAAVRQWVLSVPVPLRYWMAKNPKLMGSVLNITTRVIGGFYRRRAKARGLKNSQTGSVTMIQRFGDACRLNVHFHELWMEGAFVLAGPDGRPEYRWIPKPTDTEILELLALIRARTVRLLIRRGYIEKDESPKERFLDDVDLLDSVMAASTQNRIATGERAGMRVRRVGSFGEAGERPELTGALCAEVGGFSLHANVFIEPGKRDKLERLCRYLARPPVAESRLLRLENGDIGYRLKSRWSDGTVAVRFSPLEFIEKLVALIPPPRVHMIRYHGVLAPNHSWRSQVVPAPKPSEESSQEGVVMSLQQRMSWAECLKRTFNIDLTTCPDCGGAVRFIGAVMKREVVVKILSHLRIPVELPSFVQPRAPPTLEFEF